MNAENTVAKRADAKKPELIRIGGQIEDGGALFLSQDTIKYMPVVKRTGQKTKSILTANLRRNCWGVHKLRKKSYCEDRLRIWVSSRSATIRIC